MFVCFTPFLINRKRLENFHQLDGLVDMCPLFSISIRRVSPSEGDTTSVIL